MNKELITKLENINDTVFKTGIALNRSELKIQEDEHKGKKLDILKEIQKTKDIDTILEAEKFCVTQDLEKSLFSEQQGRSLRASLKEYNNGLKSVDAVENKKDYRIAAKTYPLNKIEAGLPIDGFRQFAKSQISRLDNSLKSPPSKIDKEILEQRQKNIVTCVEIYKEKQLKALTVTQREKEADAIRNIDLKNINEKDFNKPELKKALQLIKNVQVSVAHTDKETQNLIVQSLCTKLAHVYETGQKMSEIHNNKNQNKDIER